MKREDLTKTFMMILNRKKQQLWAPWFIQTYFSVVTIHQIASQLPRFVTVLIDR